MDRRVKERLIGATILVVLIVLIVPELLSGPKRAANAPPPAATGPAEPLRNVTVDLATSKATPAAETQASSAASVAEAPPTPATPGEIVHPAPSGAELLGGSASSEPDAAPRRRAAAPPTITTLQAQQPAPALENETSSPKSPPVAPKSSLSREPAPAGGSRHGWAVQLGSFASSPNAEKLQHRLKAQSFSAYISSSGTGKTLRYRVRVGPMADRAAADRMIAKLRKDGHPASVVAP